MRNLITGIGLILLVTGCSKEPIQPECEELLINTDVSIFAVRNDQLPNNTVEWRYLAYFDLDSNNIDALDKFMDNYALYLSECPDIYETPQSNCAANADYWWFWNWNQDDLGFSLPVWLAQPDLEIITDQQYIPWIQDAWSPIGQPMFYLTPHDLNISINNGDSIIFY